MYSFFLERLFFVFTVHKYRFSPKFKYCSRLYLSVYCISMLTVGWTCSKHYHIIENNHIICIGNYPFYVTAIVAIFDFGTIFSLSILFTRRLMLLVIENYSCALGETLNSNTANSVPKSVTSPDKAVMIALNKDEEMMAMMKRITLLTMISLITTFLSLMLLSIFELQSVWSSIDFCINNWCIV
eukprot:295112_1